MERINLLIKFKNQYLCEKIHNEIDFIHVPNYFNQEPFSNISIFITLLFHGILDQNYYSKINLTDMEWSKLFEIAFDPDLFFQIGKSTFLYDMDELLRNQILPLESTLNNLPPHLIFISEKEEQILKPVTSNYENEETPYGYHNSVTFINQEVLTLIRKLKVPRTNKDVLLMYSGGKDSTLAAIRLVKLGYHVHLIHFDNGHMRDTNKPFLTYQESLSKLNGFYFPYQFSSIDISSTFQELFPDAAKVPIKHESIESEIQCLSCRSAMYLKAIAIAKKYHYPYIAEGARMSQKFIIEQPVMLEKFRELASKHGITLLLPVLALDNDDKEINELLSSGFSAKSWESKCLLGKRAKEKTPEDIKQLLEYYKNNIEPVCKQKIYHL